MSHRDDCKDPREARREGERAFERGWGRNPYRDHDFSRESYGDRRCREEAERAWSAGYSSAEYRAEEEAAERRAQERRAAARREEEAYESYLLDEQARYEQSYPEPEPSE